jgi:hypothetical protein
MKTFGDLKPGDNVFWISSDWIFHTIEILDVIYGRGDVRLTLANNAWSGYYSKEFISSRNNFLWSDREEALKFALEKTKKERDYLSRKIDEMISKYDEIEKFIEKYEGC